MGTDGALHTAARDDDNSRLLNRNENRDEFENEDNVSEILKKMK